MRIRPVLHRVFVKPDQVEEVDETIKRARNAGIVVELDKREKKAVVLGTILAIGSTCYLGFQSTADKEGIKIGSRVLYAKYSGADVPNEDYIVLNDEDIIGVIEDE